MAGNNCPIVSKGRDPPTRAGVDTVLIVIEKPLFAMCIWSKCHLSSQLYLYNLAQLFTDTSTGSVNRCFVLSVRVLEQSTCTSCSQSSSLSCGFQKVAVLFSYNNYTLSSSNRLLSSNPTPLLNFGRSV